MGDGVGDLAGAPAQLEGQELAKLVGCDGGVGADEPVGFTEAASPGGLEQSAGIGVVGLHVGPGGVFHRPGSERCGRPRPPSQRPSSPSAAGQHGVRPQGVVPEGGDTSRPPAGAYRGGPGSDWGRSRKGDTASSS